MPWEWLDLHCLGATRHSTKIRGKHTGSYREVCNPGRLRRPELRSSGLGLLTVPVFTGQTGAAYGEPRPVENMQYQWELKAAMNFAQEDLMRGQDERQGWKKLYSVLVHG
ncbi:hypothetical protein DFH09DRAFT_1089579 [Mycena vulgaris]|nr:hypothetical protein DFH09DRAFT_1089579 [Mycena vulgaris]